MNPVRETVKFIRLLATGLIVISPALYAQAPSQGSLADIFFLDLGIVIEPSTGNETYNRKVEAPSAETAFRIKKVQSGSVYVSTSKEMLAALERINQRISTLEQSLKTEVQALRMENQELRTMLADYLEPPVEEPPLPEVPLEDEDLVPTFLSDEPVDGELPIAEVPPPITLPAPPPRAFDQTAYMSAVFAYQREDYVTALNYFSHLALDQAPPQVADNVLYWMADAYQQLGNYEEALALLDQVVNRENSPRVDDALIQQGLLYRRLGQDSLSLSAFKQVVANYPSSEYVKLAQLELKRAELLP